MHINLNTCFASIFAWALFLTPFANAGFNTFSKIDTYEKWIIEQKFDSEKNEIFCRASRKGYGTWFDERIRIDKNNELVFPTGITKKNYPSKALLKKILISLENCRSDLLYLQK